MNIISKGYKMNGKTIKRILRSIKVYKDVISLSFTAVTLIIIIITFFVTLNLRVTQIADAENQLEQGLKVNNAAHANFVTKQQFETSINSIQQVVNETYQAVQVVDYNVRTLKMK